MTLVINGFNFDPSEAGNVVTLSSGTVGSVMSASTTSLTIMFAMTPNPGPLSASVTAFGLSSGMVLVATVPSNLLVVNGGTSSIMGCTLSGSSLTSCSILFGPEATTGTWNVNKPQGVAIANNVAYITNLPQQGSADPTGSGTGNTVSQCAISGGSITSCSVPSGVTWNLNNPSGIAIQNNVAYITNNNGNTVTQCQISGGSITSCAVPTGVTWNLNGPSGIAIQNDVAYITNFNVNTVTQCTITSGSITSCAVPTGVTLNLNGPWGIAVANNVAYITNYNVNTVTQCTITSGSITSCTVPTGFDWNLQYPIGIAIQNNVAYIVSQNSVGARSPFITQCAINGQVGGSIFACSVPTFFNDDPWYSPTTGIYYLFPNAIALI